MIAFKTVRWKNFLATGNDWNEIQLNRSPSTLITGENGAGKCLHPSTLIDIEFEDETTKEIFDKFIKSRK